MDLHLYTTLITSIKPIPDNQTVYKSLSKDSIILKEIKIIISNIDHVFNNQTTIAKNIAKIKQLFKK